MVTSFFGLDLKSGGNLILLATLAESMVLYVLSLVFMVESKESRLESKYRSVLLYQEELQSYLSAFGCKLTRKFIEIFELLVLTFSDQ